MTNRLPELEARINAIGKEGVHHDVYHFVQHCIRSLRRLESQMQDENRSSREHEMHTVHTTIDRSVSELVTVLEKTVEDWEHRVDKSKKNFEDGVD